MPYNPLKPGLTWWPAPDTSRGIPICWGKFPYEKDPGEATPQLIKERPLLVFEAFNAPTELGLPAGALLVIVAMGTTNWSGEHSDEAEPQPQFLLKPANPGELEAFKVQTGLWKPTLFQFDQIHCLYYNSDWFTVPTYRPAPMQPVLTPQMGSFPPASRDSLDEVLYGKDGNDFTIFADKFEALLEAPPATTP